MISHAVQRLPTAPLQSRTSARCWRPLRRLASSAAKPQAVRTPAASPITARGVNFSRWYQDVIDAASLVDHSPVRGCMIMRPHGFAIWEHIRDRLDAEIKATGHSNAYFPLLVPLSFLSKEAAHVDGFAQECAVVTHHRLRSAQAPASELPSGDGGGSRVLEPDPAALLREPLVIRPTSETVIWDAYRRWVTTHRDLPLLLNQWANVMRWERRTRPFLRTSEFLWQEGHTAHASEGEARAEATRMADVYHGLIEGFLGVPAVLGAKSAAERFAGAEDTFTCEAMMQNGWALQAATSHFLGQNFAKAFDVKFADAAGARHHVWATSWGASTRLIGAAILCHGDDSGLVLPPTVAPVQVAVVPIVGKAGSAGEADILQCAQQVAARLQEPPPAGSRPHSTWVGAAGVPRGGSGAACGLRVQVDADVRTPPGVRFFAWERKGVPLRVEVGARDVAAGVVTCRTRVALQGRVEVGPGVDPLEVVAGRCTVAAGPHLPAAIHALLRAVQDELHRAAAARMAGNLQGAASWGDIEGIAAAHASAHAATDDAHGEEHGEAGQRLRPGPAAGGLPSAAPGSASAAASASGAAAALQPHPWIVAPLADDPAVDARLKALKLTVRCFPSDDPARASTSTWRGLLPGVLGANAALEAAAQGLGTCAVTGQPGGRLAIIARAF